MLTAKNRQEHREEGHDKLIPLIDVKKVLAISWGSVTDLVREGCLPAYNVTGRVVRRSEITEHTRGLRVLESDLEAYIDSIKVQ